MSRYNDPEIESVVDRLHLDSEPWLDAYLDYNRGADRDGWNNRLYVFSYTFVSTHAKVKEGQVKIMVENQLYRLTTVEENYIRIIAGSNHRHEKNEPEKKK